MRWTYKIFGLVCTTHLNLETIPHSRKNKNTEGVFWTFSRCGNRLFLVFLIFSPYQARSIIYSSSIIVYCHVYLLVRHKGFPFFVYYLVRHKGIFFIAMCLCFIFVFLCRVTLPCATQLLPRVSPNGGKQLQNVFHKLLKNLFFVPNRFNACYTVIV
jgi:hypothetical protein